MDFRLFFTEFILASKSSIPSLMRKVFHCIAALNVNIVNCLAELTLMYVPLNRVALLLDVEPHGKVGHHVFHSFEKKAFKVFY